MVNLFYCYSCILISGEHVFACFICTWGKIIWGMIKPGPWYVGTDVPGGGYSGCLPVYGNNVKIWPAVTPIIPRNSHKNNNYFVVLFHINIYHAYHILPYILIHGNNITIIPIRQLPYYGYYQL